MSAEFPKFFLSRTPALCVCGGVGVTHKAVLQNRQKELIVEDVHCFKVYGLNRRAFRPTPGRFLFAAMLGHSIVEAVTLFPTDWDSLAYHLPLANHWELDRTLFVPQCAFWYVPGNHELLTLCLTAPFSGDFYAGLSNLPVIVLLVAATVEMARQCGLIRGLANVSALTVLATWPVVRQWTTNENDLAVAALFLAAIACGMKYSARRKLRHVMLFAGAVGLLAGVKYYALGYAVVAVAVTTGAALLRHGWKRAALVAVAAVVGFLLLAGYWYGRNWYYTGTPLFPKGFTPETDLWGRMRPGSETSSLWGSGRAEVWPLLVKAVAAQTGPLQLASVCLLPVTMIWMIGTAYRSGLLTKRDGTRRVMLAVAIFGAGGVYVLTPNVVETVPGTMNMLRNGYHPIRFGLCFFALAWLGLMVVLQDTWRLVAKFLRGSSGGVQPGTGTVGYVRRALPRASRVNWLVVVVALLAGYQLYSHARDVVSLDAVLLGINFFLIAALIRMWSQTVHYRRTFFIMVTMVGMIVAVVFTRHVSSRWHANFVPHYNAMMHTEVFSVMSELDPKAERICVCDYRYYPFFGSRRQYWVCRPLWIPTPESLMEYVDQWNATIVVARTYDIGAQQRYAGVVDGITSRPDKFEVFFNDDRYIAARVIR